MRQTSIDPSAMRRRRCPVAYSSEPQDCTWPTLLPTSAAALPPPMRRMQLPRLSRPLVNTYSKTITFSLTRPVSLPMIQETLSTSCWPTFTSASTMFQDLSKLSEAGAGESLEPASLPEISAVHNSLNRLSDLAVFDVDMMSIGAKL